MHFSFRRADGFESGHPKKKATNVQQQENTWCQNQFDPALPVSGAGEFLKSQAESRSNLLT